MWGGFTGGWLRTHTCNDFACLCWHKELRDVPHMPHASQMNDVLVEQPILPGFPSSWQCKTFVPNHAESGWQFTWCKWGVHTLLAYSHTCIHTSIHTYRQTYMHAYMHTHIHACMHTCIHAYMNTCIHTSMRPYMHAYKHATIHTHTYKHTYACMHACHACIHTHTYKHT